MDMKRFTEIKGREAANRLLDDLDVYSEDGNRYYMQDGTVWMESGELTGHVRLTIAETISKKWFVKKPFDVRAEMLARPNEWVGAFQNSNKEWMMIGFNESKFGVSVRFFEVLIHYLPNDGSSGGYGVTKKILDDCIPIEDVPKEEI